jgi:hypothetical protein
VVPPCDDEVRLLQFPPEVLLVHQLHGAHQPPRTTIVVTTSTTTATTITATPSRGSTSCSMRARAEASLSLTSWPRTVTGTPAMSGYTFGA